MGIDKYAGFDELWGEVRSRFEAYFPKIAWDTWISVLSGVELSGNTLVIEAPTTFVKGTVEQRYHAEMVELCCSMLDEKVEIAIRSAEQLDAPLLTHPPEPPPPPDEDSPFPSVGDYTFENFIVGSSNKLPHAACIAITESSGDVYNPLFIYGGSGLGKTHLLFAVRNQMRRLHPSSRVVYIKGEDFVNEFVASISSSSMNSFREKYRQLDMLLIDDIQFLAGKVQTQEEFFHTFNSLYEAGRQIVLTSDRPPKEISPLEERLRTRFECGLMADILPPDYETRLAIIMRKARSIGITLPGEVSEYVATKVTRNIRQLEGAVKKLAAFNNLGTRTVDIELARVTIKDILADNLPDNVVVDRIIEVVCSYNGITRDDLISSKRKSDIMFSRQVAIYLIRENTGYSLNKIGEVFGGKDHTTVINSIKRIKKELLTDRRLKNLLEEMMNTVREGD